MKMIQEYDTAAIRVTFEPKLCIHSGNCVQGLPAVFDLKRRPWVNVDGGTAAEIEAQIAKCPSAALKFQRKA
jgi:uncharacterized Fe-S cluster protein YjdI